MNNALRPVVFLDRDGTLNEEIGYIRDVSKLVLIAGAADAIKRLNDNNVAAVLVTNQTGAARGYYPEDHIKALNQRLVDLLEKAGAHLDGVYYCPHYEDGVVKELSVACQCRKPEPGMVTQALLEIPGLDKNRSYVVGDKATDVELAHQSHCKGVLVTTGYGNDVLEGKYQWKVQPDHTATNIVDAVQWILDDLEKRPERK